MGPYQVALEMYMDASEKTYRYLGENEICGGRVAPPPRQHAAATYLCILTVRGAKMAARGRRLLRLEIADLVNPKIMGSEKIQIPISRLKRGVDAKSGATPCQSVSP